MNKSPDKLFSHLLDLQSRLIKPDQWLHGRPASSRTLYSMRFYLADKICLCLWWTHWMHIRLFSIQLFPPVVKKCLRDMGLWQFNETHTFLARLLVCYTFFSDCVVVIKPCSWVAHCVCVFLGLLDRPMKRDLVCHCTLALTGRACRLCQSL